MLHVFRCLILVAASGAPGFAAVEWPQFRGPHGDGHSTAQRVPVKWSESEHVAWKTAIPGRGWSSPVIGDGLLWVTTAIEKPPTEGRLALGKLHRLGDQPAARAGEPRAAD